MYKKIVGIIFKYCFIIERFRVKEGERKSFTIPLIFKSIRLVLRFCELFYAMNNILLMK